MLVNLRLTSLLSLFSKMFEKLRKIIFVKYIDKSNVFSQNQFGFRAGRSTENTLSGVTERIHSAFNAVCKITGLFVDFRKAFDLLNHNILLT